MTITIKVKVHAAIETVWGYWNDPKAVVKWNSASSDWHTPRATNDLCVNGKFNYRMESVDGEMGFDFEGVYLKVVEFEEIEYIMADGRKVKIIFTSNDGYTEITETFDAETENPIEMQREGWQSILNNFRDYVHTIEKT